MPVTQEYTHYPTLQNTKINLEQFVFQNNHFVDYPVAPIISAKFYEVNGQLTLKIRATLYIDSAVTVNPFVEIPVVQEGTGVLVVNYCFDFADVIPASCNVWYVELDYCTPQVSEITEIEAILVNIDPVSSRGTRLQVMA
jgi:hypothetical protein